MCLAVLVRTSTAPPTASLRALPWLDADIAAAQALLGARLSSDPNERAALLQTVDVQLLRRDQLRESATFAFSQVLPIALTR